LDCILAIDAGTTGVTTLLIDHDGNVLGRGYKQITQYYPQPGWVEQDGIQIWQAVLDAVGEVLQATPEANPIAVGLANQRETLLVWERESGRPLYRAIVWQCRRSEPICQELRELGIEAEISEKTGLRLDAYFSGTKALWLIRSMPELATRVANREVCFGTVDTWLTWQLSGGQVYATDSTNASRTLAYDINRLDWDDKLLGLYGLNRLVMPEVGPSGRVRGTVKATGVPAVPIAALVGDQQAALFGQACFEPGMTKATYGTGCFVLTATGEMRVPSQNGLLATLAATASHNMKRYALEGSVFIAGAALQWCRDNLHLIESVSEGEELAASVPDSGGVVFVPAFVGLGSPHWGPDVRGALFGLTGATQSAHVVRAAIDAMVYQAQDVLTATIRHTGGPINALRVDGGAAANDRLMQLQADLAGIPISRPESVESTALGAAFLAGLAVGFWESEREISSLRKEGQVFHPSDRVHQSRTEYLRWMKAIDALLSTHGL
jgi:glycerol kinase